MYTIGQPIERGSNQQKRLKAEELTVISFLVQVNNAGSNTLSVEIPINRFRLLQQNIISEDETNRRMWITTRSLDPDSNLRF